MGNELDLSLRLPPNIESLSVLNLGAGYCASPISQQIAQLPFKSLTNIEIWPEAFAKLSQVHFSAQHVENLRDDVYVFILTAQAMRSHYDVVLMIDVLEHFSKKNAFQILDQCKRIAKHTIIWLPLGECPQDEYNGNPFQKHLSTWYATDFPGAWINVIKGQHVQFNPPVDAAWVMYG